MAEDVGETGSRKRDEEVSRDPDPFPARSRDLQQRGLFRGEARHRRAESPEPPGDDDEGERAHPQEDERLEGIDQRGAPHTPEHHIEQHHETHQRASEPGGKRNRGTGDRRQRVPAALHPDEHIRREPEQRRAQHQQTERGRAVPRAEELGLRSEAVSFAEAPQRGADHQESEGYDDRRTGRHQREDAHALSVRFARSAEYGERRHVRPEERHQQDERTDGAAGEEVGIAPGRRGGRRRAPPAGGDPDRDDNGQVEADDGEGQAAGPSPEGPSSAAPVSRRAGSRSGSTRRAISHSAAVDAATTPSWSARPSGTPSRRGSAGASDPARWSAATTAGSAASRPTGRLRPEGTGTGHGRRRRGADGGRQRGEGSQRAIERRRGPGEPERSGGRHLTGPAKSRRSPALPAKQREAVGETPAPPARTINSRWKKSGERPSARDADRGGVRGAGVPLAAIVGQGNRAAIRAAGPREERSAQKPDRDSAPSGRGAEDGALFPRPANSPWRKSGEPPSARSVDRGGVRGGGVPLPAIVGGANRAAIRAAGPREERPARKPDRDSAPFGRGAEGGALLPRVVSGAGGGGGV